MAAVKACEMLEEQAACCQEECTGESSEDECTFVSDECASASGECPPEECPVSSKDNCCKFCIICPQAYITILSGSPFIAPGFIFIKTTFPVHQVDNVNGFYTEVWKPPNSISFS